MKKRKKKDEQPYKVGKPFIKWLDSQIDIMSRVEFCSTINKLQGEIELETYKFIRGLIKP